MKIWQVLLIGGSAVGLGVVVYKLYNRKSNFMIPPPNTTVVEATPELLSKMLAKTWYSDEGTGAWNWDAGPSHIAGDNRFYLSKTKPGMLELPNWYGEVKNETFIRWISKSNPLEVHQWAGV